VKTLTVGSGSPRTRGLIANRVANPASTEELVILYRKAVFGRTIASLIEKGCSGGSEGVLLIVVVLRSLLSSDEYQGITSS
jgi:hypothetical protein